MKEKWINNETEKTFKSKEPVQEVIADPFTLDMDFILAIHIIQKNERGRQGRDRF
jgi:phage anti-repressor protein